MELLPIGTVVLLKNGEQELMITSRFPLYITMIEITGQYYESN